jgi:hypothetical protein
MSSRPPIGSTDPSLRGPSSEVPVTDLPPEAVELIGPEAVSAIENNLRELDQLAELKRQPNPFERVHGLQVDLSVFSPETAKAFLEAYSNKNQKIGPALKGMKIREFQKLLSEVQDRGIEVRRAGREANNELRSFYSGELYPLVEALNDTEYPPLDISILEAAYKRLREVSKDVPTEETIRMLAIMYDTVGQHTARQHRKIEAVAGSHPSHKPILGFFRLMRRGEVKIVGLLDGALERTKLTAQIMKDNGEEVYESLQELITLEQAKRASYTLEDILAIKARLTEAAYQSGESLPAYSVAEKYLVTQAEQLVRLLDSIDPTNGQLMEEAKEDVTEVTTPYITQTLERQRLESAESINRQLTEANDIVVGGQRLKPNKKVRQPDQLADKLGKMLNGEGQVYRVEKGLIIAILSGRFNSFRDTLDQINSEEATELLATLRPTRGRIIDILASIDLETHMDNLEVILEMYKDQLAIILSASELKTLGTQVRTFLNREEPASEVLEDTVQTKYGPEQLLEVFERSELIGILDWAILPIEEGEEVLEDAAREIVALAQERAERGVKVEIDLSRLVVLKKLRELWGKDRCEYFRGTLRNSGDPETADRPDEYIVLVMRELDARGNITLEHAVAESPIAGVNALYLLRGDVAAGNWREVFSLPKKDARALGARKLLHTKGDGRPMVEFLSERAQTLLTCNPEEFFRIRFQGPSYWLKKLGAVNIDTRALQDTPNQA